MMEQFLLEEAYRLHETYGIEFHINDGRVRIEEDGEDKCCG